MSTPSELTRSTKAQLRQKFGLYMQDLQTAIPLTGLKAEIQIDYNIARVKYNQRFQNLTENRIQVEYFFPISSSVCYDGLRIVSGKNIITASVEEKFQAEKNFKDKQAEGSTVALATKDQNILHLKIGNVEPNATIDVEFSCIEPLQVSMNKDWKYQMDQSLLPLNAEERETISEDYPKAKEMNAEIHLSVDTGDRKLGDIQCSYTKLGAKLEIADKGFAFLDFKAIGQLPAEDFIFQYTYDRVNEPTYLMGKIDEKYGMMVNYFPKIEQNVQLTQDIRTDAGETAPVIRPKKFVFVIDNHDSLGASNLAKIQRATKFLLKGLPTNSEFNFMSICGDIKTVDGSQKGLKLLDNDEHFLMNANDFLQDLTLSQGSKQLLEAFSQITKLLEHQTDENKATEASFITIFLISDGMFQNPAILNKLIQKFSSKLKLFTIGLGDQIDSNLLYSLAEQGQGHSEIISAGQNVCAKTLFLLKNSLNPYIQELSLRVDDAFQGLIDYIIPDPEGLSEITPNQMVSFFIIWNEEFKNVDECEIQLRYFDTSRREYVSYPLQIRAQKTPNADYVAKYGLFQLSRNVQQLNKVYVSQVDTSLQEVINQTELMCIDLSKKYGFLTDKTAFYCEIKDSNDVIRQIPSQEFSPSKSPSKYAKSTKVVNPMGSMIPPKSEDKKDTKEVVQELDSPQERPKASISSDKFVKSQSLKLQTHQQKVPVEEKKEESMFKRVYKAGKQKANSLLNFTVVGRNQMQNSQVVAMNKNQFGDMKVYGKKEATGSSYLSRSKMESPKNLKQSVQLSVPSSGLATLSKQRGASPPAGRGTSSQLEREYYNAQTKKKASNKGATKKNIKTKNLEPLDQAFESQDDMLPRQHSIQEEESLALNSNKQTTSLQSLQESPELKETHVLGLASSVNNTGLMTDSLAERNENLVAPMDDAWHQHDNDFLLSERSEDGIQINQPQSRTQSLGRGSLKKLSDQDKTDRAEEDLQTQDTLDEPDQLLEELVWDQKIQGYWLPLEHIFKKLVLDSSQFNESMPGSIKGINLSREIWITILVLELFERVYSQYEDILALNRKKALDWLHGRGINYRTYANQISKLKNEQK